ncbi:MAG: ZIP family metal transporter [Bordetella sp.]|nr:MAG: ZIP family metal transporter [Bordetella sp.]
MLLLWILISTITSGLITILIASWLTYKVFSKYLNHMVSLSVGILLSVGLLHLLPEAYQSGLVNQRILFSLMLASLICFFILEKIDILRHNHHYEGDGHGHLEGYDRRKAGRGGISILIGSSLHNFSDGILLSAAFFADPLIGSLTASSIIVHEIPHKLSDFVILRNAGLKLKRSFTLIFFSSLCSSLGALVGYFIFQEHQNFVPYFLVIASSSFLYIAMADLIPQMHEQKSPIETLPQILFVGIGIIVIYSITNLIQNHHIHDENHYHVTSSLCTK